MSSVLTVAAVVLIALWLAWMVYCTPPAFRGTSRTKGVLYVIILVVTIFFILTEPRSA